MPEIKRFGGFKLVMYFQDENPPHLHVRGPDFAAKLRLSNGELIAGNAEESSPRSTQVDCGQSRQPFAAVD